MQTENQDKNTQSLHRLGEIKKDFKFRLQVCSESRSYIAKMASLVVAEFSQWKDRVCEKKQQEEKERIPQHRRYKKNNSQQENSIESQKSR